MPLQVTVIPNPDVSADMAKSDEYRAIKAKGPVRMSMVTAREAVKNSKGMYKIQPKQADVVVEHKGDFDLETMGNEQLKALAVNLGVRFHKKQMKRDDLVGLVRRKLDDVSIVEDVDNPQGVTGKSNVPEGSGTVDDQKDDKTKP